MVDFSSMSDDQIKHYFLDHYNESVCGSFYNTQLDKSNKAGWKDKLINLYDQALSNSRKGFSRSVAIVIMGLLITLTGCRHRKQGGIAYDHGSIRTLDDDSTAPDRTTGDTLLVEPKAPN